MQSFTIDHSPLPSLHQITFDFTSTATVNEAAVHEEVHAVAGIPKKKGRKPKDPTTVFKKAPAKRGRKSLKDREAEADLIEIPGDEVLFQKQYYPISEVAEMFRINISQIRFWENEFDILQPKKNKKGDRLFRPEDVKNLHLIYHLLRQRKYTMEGAKEYLRKNGTDADRKFEISQSLQKIRTFLLELKSSL